MSASPSDCDLSRDKVEDIQKAFRIYDKDHDGYVTLQEAHVVLQAVLGFEMEQTKRLIEIHDRNGDGRLSYEEFIRFYTKVTQNQEELFAIFQGIDGDGSGTISWSEARKALFQMGFDDEDSQGLFRLHDRNGDGSLQFEEFVQFWKTCSNFSSD